MKTKINFRELILIILILYSIFSIVRSLGFLYLAFTDEYFYNFDFKLEGFIEKRHTFFNVEHWFTYGLGVVLSFFILMRMKIKTSLNLVYLLISLVVFFLCDLRYIRRLFDFTENPRTNMLIHIIVFSVIFLVLQVFYFKLKERTDTSTN